jgi:hypothetical protein
MKRLIVFGCSNTYGVGLSDCRDRNSPASILGWPNELATMMGISTVINLGIGGASNKHISNSLLDKAGADFFNPDTDVVVFLWSYFCRHCVFQDDGLVERYLPSDLRYNRLEPNRHKKIKRWYRDYNTSVDQQLSNYTRISHTQHYLNSKGITNYNFTCETYEYTNIPTWFDSSTLKSIDVDALSTQYGRADDNIHPSELGHSHIAEIMYKHITK